MSELNKGIDLNKKKERKELEDNLQWTTDKVWAKIDSTMDKIDNNSSVQKIWKSKIVKKTLNSKVVNNINENIISSLKLIFVIVWSFFIVLGIAGVLITLSRYDKGWIGFMWVVTFKNIINWLAILLFLFLSLVISIGDIIAWFAIIKQKKWTKTILLIMLAIAILMFLLSLVYLKDRFGDGNNRTKLSWYVPDTIGAIFRITFYVAITILVFKNYDTLSWKEKASDDGDEEYEDEEYEYEYEDEDEDEKESKE